MDRDKLVALAGEPSKKPIDWGEHWIPDTLPTVRSTRNLAAWFSSNVGGLVEHLQGNLSIAVGGGDDKPFYVVAFDMDGHLSFDRPLLTEFADDLDSYRCGDGTIHESHRDGLRGHITELVAYLNGVLDELASTPREGDGL